MLDCSERERELNCPIISLDHLSVESSLISQTVLQISLYITQLTEPEIHARASPFLLHMMYRVAMLYLKASRVTPNDSLTDKLHVVKQGLEILGRRYHAARMCLNTSFLFPLYANQVHRLIYFAFIPARNNASNAVIRVFEFYTVVSFYG